MSRPRPSSVRHGAMVRSRLCHWRIESQTRRRSPAPICCMVQVVLPDRADPVTRYARPSVRERRDGGRRGGGAGDGSVRTRLFVAFGLLAFRAERRGPPPPLFGARRGGDAAPREGPGPTRTIFLPPRPG